MVRIADKIDLLESRVAKDYLVENAHRQWNRLAVVEWSSELTHEFFLSKPSMVNESPNSLEPDLVYP